MPFQFFLGSPGVVDEAADTYVLTQSASLARVDFAGLGEPSYVLTPDAGAYVSRSVSASSTYTMEPSDGAIHAVSSASDSTYVFTPLATSTVIRVVASVGTGDEPDEPTYVFTPLATSGVDRLVDAASTYVFAPDSSERHDESGSASSTYVFTPVASVAVDFGVGSGLAGDVPTYVLTPVATSRVPNPHRRSEPVDYIFAAVASAVVVTITCTPLGRFRRGDAVPVLLPLPFVPDASPYAVVLDEGDVVVGTLRLAAKTPGGGDFAAGLYLGREYALGGYTLAFTATAGGVPQGQRDQCFRVVGGGDAGGPVIALASYSRGVQRAVLAHLGSGELVLGRNPSLDLTPTPSLPPGWQYATGHPGLG